MSNALFATAATADRADADTGVIWWATDVEGYALAILDYDLFAVRSVNSAWAAAFFKRSAELVAQHTPAVRGCHLRVEHAGLVDLLRRADDAFRDTKPADAIDRSAFDIRPVREHESARWPSTFDERAYAVRPLVGSEKVIKPATGMRIFPWKSINANHLAAQVRRHKPGDPASELVGAFILGVLLGTTKRRMSFFGTPPKKPNPETSPFGPYVRGGRPL
jgi:hypothetical protein